MFDVDDTLYLERDYVASGFAAIEKWCAEHLATSGVGTRAWELFEAGGRGDTVTRALAACGILDSDAVIGVLVQMYREHVPTIDLLADARDVIQALHGRTPMSVVTDGPASSQHKKIAALGIAQFADPIVVTADLHSSKPDPAVFLAAAAHWQLEPEEIVYIADNPAKDFVGPSELGWQSVRVRRPGSLHAHLPSPGGVLEIESLADDRLQFLLRLDAGQYGNASRQKAR